MVIDEMFGLGLWLLDVWIQLHGALMIIAWLFCSSVGGVCARYFKPILKQKVLDKDLWFTVSCGRSSSLWRLSFQMALVERSRCTKGRW